MAGSAALFLNKAEASILCRYLTDGVHSKIMLFHSSYIMHFGGGISIYSSQVGKFHYTKWIGSWCLMRGPGDAFLCDWTIRSLVGIVAGKRPVQGADCGCGWTGGKVLGHKTRRWPEWGIFNSSQQSTETFFQLMEESFSFSGERSPSPQTVEGNKPRIAPIIVFHDSPLLFFFWGRERKKKINPKKTA